MGPDWRSAALLRTLCRYRSQSGLDPSEPVQVRALAEHPDIANNLLKLFGIKFDPAAKSDLDARERKAAAPVIAEIEKQLEAVATLDADRALRRLLSLVKSLSAHEFLSRATLRGSPIAISQSRSPAARPTPCPRRDPIREIFVWSPDVEGVHLRFGPVARGGLRWSDRRDDFRTEVLGLVKAQQVKNAVIVPVGSKGGFYPKSLPAKGTREEIQAAGIAAYKTFVGALLQTHRQHRRRQNRASAGRRRRGMGRTRISSSPPTRARPRSPTSRTAFRPTTISGSAMHSRRAARSATTTRRWASRRAAHGRP